MHVWNICKTSGECVHFFFNCKYDWQVRSPFLSWRAGWLTFSPSSKQKDVKWPHALRVLDNVQYDIDARFSRYRNWRPWTSCSNDSRVFHSSSRSFKSPPIVPNSFSARCALKYVACLFDFRWTPVFNVKISRRDSLVKEIYLARVPRI